MNTAAAAAEYRANVGPEFAFADAFDSDYLDTEAEAEDEKAERQALNARMAEWYGIG